MTNALIKILEEQPRGTLELDVALLSHLHKYVDQVLGCRVSPMELTQDLGAATVLVPLGWQTVLRWPFCDTPRALCQLTHMEHTPLAVKDKLGRWHVRSMAATPALAVCAAVLKILDLHHGATCKWDILERPR